MKQFNYIVTDEAGMHARPAGALVKAVKQCGSKVTLTKGEKTVNAAGLLAIMGLGIKKGEEITITVEEDAAFEEIKDFVVNNI